MSHRPNAVVICVNLRYLREKEQLADHADRTDKMRILVCVNLRHLREKQLTDSTDRTDQMQFPSA